MILDSLLKPLGWNFDFSILAASAHRVYSKDRNLLVFSMNRDDLWPEGDFNLFYTDKLRGSDVLEYGRQIHNLRQARRFLEDNDIRPIYMWDFGRALEIANK